MINLMSPNVVIPNLVYNVYIILKKWTRLGHAVVYKIFQITFGPDWVV